VANKKRSDNNFGKMSEQELKQELEKEQKLLEENEIKAGKLKKKMLIFGIVLLVLIAAYVALAMYTKTMV